MSDFESGGSSRTMIMAVVVIVIIIGAGVSLMLLGNPPGPSGNETTTTSSTTTGPTTTTGPWDGSITILTRHDLSIQNVFEPIFLASDFAVQNGITDIKWRTPAPEFWDDLIREGTIDVCWGGGPTLFDQLIRDNYLAPLTSTKMVEVSARINDTISGIDMKRNNTSDELTWIAAAISTFGFTVNNQFLTDYSLPTPSKWTDLANLTYAQYLPTIPTLAMGNAPDTTSNTKIYHIMTQALGWDEGWINMARMAGSSEIHGGSVETQNAVESGDVGIAMSIDFYGYLTQYRNPDCEYIVPEGQSIVNGDPIAIPSTSSHKAMAEGFLDFVLSAEGQALWLDIDIRRMPIMREAFDLVSGVDDLYLAFNRTTATVGIEFDDSLELSMNRPFIYYFEAVFTDSHADLVNCWSAIYDAWFAGTINEAEVNYYAGLMGAVVSIIDPKTALTEEFTLAYAQSIDYDMVYDPSYASTVQSRWTIAAKIQYQTVQALVEGL